MKVGLMADVHGHLRALQTALKMLDKSDVDEILLAGDSIYEFRFSADVVDTLKRRGVRVLLGNHDIGFLQRRSLMTGRHDNALIDWLGAQPEEIRVDLGGRQLLSFHASPWQPRYQYLYPNHPSLPRLADLGADIVVYGHTHIELAQQFGRTLIINPGSVGEPRDCRNEFSGSAAIMDTSSLEVEFVHFPVDPIQR